MEGLLVKKAGEMVFGTTEQPEPDEQSGGKRKRKLKKSADEEEKHKRKGGDDNVEDLDPWKEISKAIFSGGNKKEKTFFENRINYPVIIFTLMALGIHPISILLMGIFNFNPIIMVAVFLFNPFNNRPLFDIVTTYKDNRPLKNL